MPLYFNSLAKVHKMLENQLKICSWCYAMLTSSTCPLRPYLHSCSSCSIRLHKLFSRYNITASKLNENIGKAEMQTFKLNVQVLYMTCLTVSHKESQPSQSYYTDSKSTNSFCMLPIVQSNIIRPLFKEVSLTGFY